ncbi:hypothetical protein [Halorubrum depositum]|uniref:hypothetical protein n=1 Tax=Halorubrum depositum TaxID=2583992 RepID=UPI0011A14DB5|nr:hypothetical protein [Halorubrum depositum]
MRSDFSAFLNQRDASMRYITPVTQDELASMLADVLSDVLREDCRIEGFQETHHFNPEMTEIDLNLVYYLE